MSESKAEIAAVEGWFEGTGAETRLVGSRCTTCNCYFFPKETFFCRNPECHGANPWTVLDSLMESVAVEHADDATKSRIERESEHLHHNRFFEFCARHNIPRDVHKVPRELRDVTNPPTLRELLCDTA